VRFCIKEAKIIKILVAKTQKEKFMKLIIPPKAHKNWKSLKRRNREKKFQSEPF
jgi:hypothetical protein